MLYASAASAIPPQQAVSSAAAALAESGLVVLSTSGPGLDPFAPSAVPLYTPSSASLPADSPGSTDSEWGVVAATGDGAHSVTESSARGGPTATAPSTHDGSAASASNNNETMGAEASPRSAQRTSRGAVDEPRDPVQSRQRPLALFHSVLILPLPQSVSARSVSVDSALGVVTISPAPSEEWQSMVSTRIADSRTVDRIEADAGAVRLVFASLSTTAIVVQAFPLQTKYLVVGGLRFVPNPRRHFMLAQCEASVLEPSNQELAAAIVAYCADDSLHDLARLEGTSSLPSTERQVATVLRFEATAVGSRDGALRLSRLRENGVGVQSRVAAATATAFGHALRDELPAALDSLHEALLAVPSVGERAGLTRTAVREFGSAVFARLMAAALDSGEPMAAVYYAERFEYWNVERLPAEARLALGGAYDSLHMPGRAAELYVSAYSSGVVDELGLLGKLAASYHASGDHFRAVETVEFLREQAPNADVTRDASRLIEADAIDEQTSCVERAASASGSVSLFAALQCARNTGDARLVADVGTRLLDAESQSPVFGAEFAQLLVRDAQRAVSVEGLVR